MKNKYSCIFFDLDHTLWDYETNSRQSLEELYVEYNLIERGVRDVESFHARFREVNAQLWHLYDHGKIDSTVIREQRFKQILETFNGYEKELCDRLSHDYLYRCPQKGHLIPHAKETLEYLSRNYLLGIITNGFEEIQNTKIRTSGIADYFDQVITSQKAGHKKPAREIFQYALTSHSKGAHETVMIGDNLVTDISGARNASIDTVYFNPDSITHNELVSFEIKNLKELCSLL